MMFRPLLLLCLGHCLPGANSQTIYTTGAIGGTVTLRCDGPAATDTKDVHVMWMFGGRPACWFKNGSWCETGHYVNRTRLESIRQNNFSLVINPVRKEDDGVYMCRINHKTIQSIHLNVTGGQTQTTGVTADPVCRPYTEREVSTGSEDNQDSVENHAGEFIPCVINMLLPQCISCYLYPVYLIPVSV
nr:uncharacterized protein LOC111841538 isoform X2 [Paramormyrops kingsleyae]